MNDADIQVLYGEHDDETNTVPVTLKVPKTMDPELAEALFRNAIKNMQEDYR